MTEISMKQLLEAGVHFGHQTSRWNPKMKPYIFGARNGIYIIDLQKTVELWVKARQAVVQTVANGGKVLFVGTKKQAADTVEEEAKRCNMFFITHRWLGGLMTNFVTIKKSIERLKELEAMAERKDWGLATKKEQLKLEKAMVKLQTALGGIKNMSGVPELIFVVDPRKEHIAVHEANRLSVPVVAMIDTNSDPEPIDFIIPSNDDAIRAIKLFTGAVADAVLEGQASFEENLRQRRSHEEEVARKPLREKMEEVAVEAPSPAGVNIEIKRSRRPKPKRADETAAEEVLAADEPAADEPAADEPGEKQ